MREATRGEMTRGVKYMRRLLHPGVTSRCHKRVTHQSAADRTSGAPAVSRVSLAKLSQTKQILANMARAAPDAPSLLHLTSPAANDAALKALLGSAAGKNFRVGPEHFLAKSAGDTAIVVGPAGRQLSSKRTPPTSLKRGGG